VRGIKQVGERRIHPTEHAPREELQQARNARRGAAQVAAPTKGKAAPQQHDATPAVAEPPAKQKKPGLLRKLFRRKQS
jgi:hypothetical protein